MLVTYLVLPVVKYLKFSDVWHRANRTAYLLFSTACITNAPGLILPKLSSETADYKYGSQKSTIYNYKLVCELIGNKN